VVALLALLLGVARPPAAYVSVGSQRVPLAISSWCWASRCGAPIAASTRAVTVGRGETVRVELKFTATRARLAVAGVPQQVTIRGRELSWHATRAGGLALNVTAARGWITYVGRLRFR
jgi:hypothetical protein